MIKLLELNAKDSKARKEFLTFVNKNYKSKIPLKENTITQGQARFFWAMSGAKRIGVTGFVEKTAYLAESIKTVIDSKYQGKGYGEKVSQAIEDEVKRRGYKKIMSTIYVTNLPMIFIKLKQGYLIEGFHPDHEKPGLHEYSLGKVLK